MTEGPKVGTRFARRRVILGVASLVAILLGLGAIFGIFDSPVPLRARFVGFDTSADGISPVAVVVITNMSNRTFQFQPYAGDTIYGGFVFRGLTGETWTTDQLTRFSYLRTFDLSTIQPHTEVKQTILLPLNGRGGRVTVWCLPTPKSLPGVLKFARPLWWKLNPPRLKPFWTMCDQEIQCPLIRSDGQVEPPRVIAKGGLAE